MSLYQGKAAKESSGTWEPGAYKFKITFAEVHSSGSIRFSMKTWTEDGADGPELKYCWLNINSEKQGALDEVDRRLTTILGKSSLDSEQELVGKAGYVVLQKPEKFLEPMPFGGFYTTERKSATGKQSMAERIAEALKVENKAAPAATPEDDDSTPF